jgi:uncharacterized membrane protein YphA (DoxX/SURF4 family)
MRARVYGTIVFGVSAAMFGIASLAWHQSDLWQRVRAWGLPFGPVISWILALALVAGGLAAIYPRTARFAAACLAVIYAVIALFCIGHVVAAPSKPVLYVDLFEQLSILCGAVAMYALTDASATGTTLLVRFARFGLAASAISFAWAQVFYLKFTASLVPSWIPPSQVFWTILTTVAFGLAAIAILLNLRSRLAMCLMAVMLGLFAALVWIPKIVTDPSLASNWTELASNNLIAASALLVAALAVRKHET